jgi:tripartite-type tricarboxylate transporter receptor subunit TctC
MFNFRAAMTALAGIAFSLATPQFAAAQSDQPIHIVVPYAGGGMIDSVVRMLAEDMAIELGQPVVVDNKPGANGIVGSEYVASAKADGLTLLSGGTGPVSLNALLRPNLPYKVSDFAPVAMLFDGPLSVTVPTKLGVNSIQELVTYSKENNRPLRYATLGPGSVTHLFGLMLGKRLGVEMVPVAYRNNPAALVDLLGGQNELNFSTPISLTEYMKTGEVKVLALTTQERSASYPDIPTLVELGYPKLVASFWTGLLAPAGTPQDVIDRTSAAAVNAMALEKNSSFLSKRGLNPKPGGTKAMAEQLKFDDESWGSIIKQENIVLSD